MELTKSFSLNISENRAALDYSVIYFDDPPKTPSYSFEVIDWAKWGHFMDNYWQLSIIAGALYIMTIFSLKAYMENRKPFVMKREVFVWNLWLGLFSMIGLTRTFPGFMNVLSEDNGFYKSVCVLSGVTMSQVFWSYGFLYLKYVALGDVILMILRKKPLIFLQWYHRLLTFVVCWLMGPLFEPIAMYYVILNYVVHSLMYPYFAVKALGVQVPRWISNAIKFCEFVQILVGLFANIYSIYLIKNGANCRRFPLSIYGSFIVYGTFLFLFGKLCVDVISKSRMVCKTRKID